MADDAPPVAVPQVPNSEKSSKYDTLQHRLHALWKQIPPSRNIPTTITESLKGNEEVRERIDVAEFRSRLLPQHFPKVSPQDICKFRELRFVPEFEPIPKSAWEHARSEIQRQRIRSKNLFRAMLLDDALLAFLEKERLVVPDDFFGNAEIVGQVWRKALVAVADYLPLADVNSEVDCTTKLSKGLISDILTMLSPTVACFDQKNKTNADIVLVICNKHEEPNILDRPNPVQLQNKMLDWQLKSLFEMNDFCRALEDLPAAVCSMMHCRDRTDDLLAYEIIQATSPKAPYHTYMAFLQGRAVFDDKDFVGYDIALVWEVTFPLKWEGDLYEPFEVKAPHYPNLKKAVTPVDGLIELGRLVRMLFVIAEGCMFPTQAMNLIYNKYELLPPVKCEGRKTTTASKTTDSSVPPSANALLRCFGQLEKAAGVDPKSRMVGHHLRRTTRVYPLDNQRLCILKAAPSDSALNSCKQEVAVVQLARDRKLRHILHEEREMELHEAGLIQKVPVCSMLDTLHKHHPSERQHLLLLFVTQLPDLLEELRDNRLLYTDAKPANIGIYRQHVLKLCDLDSVVEYEDADVIPKPRLHTPAFAAEEVRDGHQSTVSIQADVQAFALLLDDVLCTNQSVIPESIHHALGKVVSAYNVPLSKRPSYDSFVQDLRAARLANMTPNLSGTVKRDAADGESMDVKDAKRAKLDESTL